MGDDVARQYDDDNTCEHGKLVFNCPICDGPVDVRLQASLENERSSQHGR